MNRCRVWVAAVTVFVTACATVPSEPTPRGVGVDGHNCAGSVPDQPASGLLVSANPTLLDHARGATGAGKLCDAKVFAVTQPIRLYRLYTAGWPNSKFGGWWAIEKPTGSKASYQSTYAVCPEWNELDRLVVCEVRPGSQIVIGDTQAALCKDGQSLPKTTALQVFVPNEARGGIVHVGVCEDRGNWP